MCMEQGQHNPRKNYPWHPLCHGFIRYTDDYFSVESCRSSSSSLPTNRIPGLAVGVILMISPSTSTLPPSVIVYAAQTSLGLPILEASLDSLETLFEFLGILPYMEFASPSTRTPRGHPAQATLSRFPRPSCGAVTPRRGRRQEYFRP